MFEVTELPEFSSWMRGLKDINAKARILLRLRRFEFGNLGDVKSVGQGILEHFPNKLNRQDSQISCDVIHHSC